MTKFVQALVASSAVVFLSACTAEEAAVENAMMTDEAPSTIETLPVEDMNMNEFSTDTVEDEGLTNETVTPMEGEATTL